MPGHQITTEKAEELIRSSPRLSRAHLVGLVWSDGHAADSREYQTSKLIAAYLYANGFLQRTERRLHGVDNVSKEIRALTRQAIDELVEAKILTPGIKGWWQNRVHKTYLRRFIEQWFAREENNY